jgi:hypothetical protein
MFFLKIEACLESLDRFGDRTLIQPTKKRSLLEKGAIAFSMILYAAVIKITT